VQVNTAIIHFKVLETCGGGDSIRSPRFDFIKVLCNFINQKNKLGLRHHAAAGFAVDRLEGDSIKIESCFAWQLGEALAVFGHGCNKKNN
jgi:hypothetical protein